jgi:hypothetical protein
MTTDTFLARDEITGLTNKIQRTAQVKALNSMGIEHKVRPDGSIAILRDHITKVFGGNSGTQRRSSKPHGPNWDAI